MKFRIIASNPNKLCSAYKVQVEQSFLFWKYWEDISTWQWSVSDCDNLIKVYKGEVSNVVKEVS